MKVVFFKERKAFFKLACNSVHDIGSTDCNVRKAKGIFPKVMNLSFLLIKRSIVLQEFKVKSARNFANLF